MFGWAKGKTEKIISQNYLVNLFHLPIFVGMNHIGTTIKKYRVKKELSQQRLATLAGVSHKNVISAIERGVFKPSPDKLLPRICKVLDLDIQLVLTPKK